jgi:hypothetical protein
MRLFVDHSTVFKLQICRIFLAVMYEFLFVIQTCPEEFPGSLIPIL